MKLLSEDRSGELRRGAPLSHFLIPFIGWVVIWMFSRDILNPTRRKRVRVSSGLWDEAVRRTGLGSDDEIISFLLERCGRYEELERSLDCEREELKDMKGEMEELRRETRVLEKEKKRLLQERDTYFKKTREMGERLRELEGRIAKIDEGRDCRDELEMRENTIRELEGKIDDLRMKKDELKKRNLRYQTRIRELNDHISELGRTERILRAGLSGIRSRNHGVLLMVPRNPLKDPPRLEVLDSTTYYGYKGDRQRMLRENPFDGELFLMELPLVLPDTGPGMILREREPPDECSEG
ncbi:hypothetical protein B6U90_05565 [Thermoplasmatales archaeon ex4484_6]|nr:MAG: hypothetical protein B6U90_05565 [Thermoplasmatales archaeon ex4484_6]RLF67428.1 MAG: hypothetical protein DRN57_05680 [Thermoplasmata archaeon]